MGNVYHSLLVKVNGEHMGIHSIMSPFCMPSLNISSYNSCVLFIRKHLILNHIPKNKEQLFLMNLPLCFKNSHCFSDGSPPQLILFLEAFRDMPGVDPEARGLLPSLALSMYVLLTEMRA